MTQETDVSNKPKEFIQLLIPSNVTVSETESIKELILKNETSAQGDVYVEGSMKQLRNLFKNHLVVKPACLFDTTIKLDVITRFANNDGRYQENDSRTRSFELSQVQKASVRSELDHNYKYRFLHVNEAGDILPLYSPSQTIAGGAGDLMLTFTGHKGSGFEYCDATTQTLTRGSQYQTSFLPEMANGEDYRIKVKATYKDSMPIEWDLNVNYLPNLDGVTRFVDLGTHIFYGNSTQRPAVPYKFALSNVIDSQDDDLDVYDLTLNNGMTDYFEVDEQENIITISDTKSSTVPKLGESIAYVTSDDTF